MKLLSQKRHAIDFLFPVTVFFVFTISALTVILLAARIYQSTTDDSQRNYTSGMRRTKLPIVKAKIGPRIMTMVADEKIFDLIPLKKEVKATISGIYITSINNFRKAPVPEPEKKGFVAKIRKKADKAQENIDAAKVKQEKAKKDRKKK